MKRFFLISTLLALIFASCSGDNKTENNKSDTVQDSIDKVERAKQDSIKTAEKEQKRIDDSIYFTDKTIKIIDLHSTIPDPYVGGVDLVIVWKNNTGKRLKYVTFEVVAYNAVGDNVYCEIKDEYSFRGQITGPIEPNETHGYGRRWEAAWYNNTIDHVELIEIDISFMDDTKQLIIDDKDKLKYLQ